MKMRTLLLAMIPCFMAVGCLESDPADQDAVRAIPAEPCSNVDCVPLADSLTECPEGTELVSEAECVDVQGECVWDVYEECVGDDDMPPLPPPPNPGNNPGPPSNGPPRPVAPPTHG